jgi:hypothetical protein
MDDNMNLLSGVIINKIIMNMDKLTQKHTFLVPFANLTICVEEV